MLIKCNNVRKFRRRKRRKESGLKICAVDDSALLNRRENLFFVEEYDNKSLLCVLAIIGKKMNSRAIVVR
jgi:hypothetical protein